MSRSMPELVCKSESGLGHNWPDDTQSDPSKAESYTIVVYFKITIKTFLLITLSCMEGIFAVIKMFSTLTVSKQFNQYQHLIFFQSSPPHLVKCISTICLGYKTQGHVGFFIWV